MKITKIQIQNIKGFSDVNNEIDVNIETNKINLLIAPNGFGKSSIATAFNSLLSTRLDLSEEDFYQTDKTVSPLICLTMDNNEVYEANLGKNDIDSVLKCYVINSRIEAKAKKSRYYGVGTPVGYLDIGDVTIVRSVPSKIKYNYNYRKITRWYGVNHVILDNLSPLFDDYHFLVKVMNAFPSLNKFCSKGISKKRKEILNDIKNEVQKIRGSNKQCIIGNVQDNIFDELSVDIEYKKIQDLISDFTGRYTRLQKYGMFIQLLYIYDNDAMNLTKACKRAEFELLKHKFNDSLKALDTSWKDIEGKETKNGHFTVNFPHANELSNGQRDLMTFYCQLKAFQLTSSTTKPNLLIIDEVFDYLDDANLLAAQYYLTQIFKENGAKTFVVVLTHLSPRLFMSNIFTKKRLNIQFLKKNANKKDNSLRNLIYFRGKLSDATDNIAKDAYDKISTFLFHYNPNANGKIVDVNAIRYDKNIGNFLNVDKLKLYLSKEITSYLNSHDYDALAVSLGLRFKIEKNVYEKILLEENKQKFISIHGTNKKLNFAEENTSVEVLEVSKVLSPIFNDIEHAKDCNEMEIMEETIAYKLSNLAITHIIKNIFSKDNVEVVDL